MFSHLFSGTFIVNAFWILVFCMILVPVLYMAYRGAVSIIGGLAAGDGIGDNKAGCMGLIVLVAFIYFVLFVCRGLADKFVTMPDPPSKQNADNPELNRRQGPVLIFRKEAPLLYNYYEELCSYQSKQEAYLTRLKEEYEQTSTEAARDALISMQKKADAQLAKIKEMRSRIEDIAGRVHFARYMAALGMEINENSLQSDIKNATNEGADILTKQKDL